MKTITLTLTDAEASLLDAQAVANSMPAAPGMAGSRFANFQEEVEAFKSQRLDVARAVAKQRITQDMSDEQLAAGLVK